MRAKLILVLIKSYKIGGEGFILDHSYLREQLQNSNGGPCLEDQNAPRRSRHPRHPLMLLNFCQLSSISAVSLLTK